MARHSPVELTLIDSKQGSAGQIRAETSTLHSMSIEALQGRAYERVFRTDRSRVSAFVEATGDDEERWSESAPPALAGAALFAVAPAFLYDPDVGEFSNVMIHAEQTFRWRAPWQLDTDYIVTGSVDRVRMRGGSAWVTFGAVVTNDDDTTLESLSTFIMSDQRSESDLPERQESAPFDRSQEVRPNTFPRIGAVPETVRSASRSDLIRYAAASRDYNPLHWDHGTARNAGLPGVVAHGLLMVSWMIQPAVHMAKKDAAVPVCEAKFRFRNPLFAGEAASITGEIGDSGDVVKLKLESASGPLVTGSITVAG